MKSKKLYICIAVLILAAAAAVLIFFGGARTGKTPVYDGVGEVPQIASDTIIIEDVIDGTEPLPDDTDIPIQPGETSEEAPAETLVFPAVYF